MDRCTCTTTGLGRHMGICLWVVDTYSTDQMLAFESVGRVVSNVECGWSTYNLFFFMIFFQNSTDIWSIQCISVHVWQQCPRIHLPNGYQCINLWDPWDTLWFNVLFIFLDLLTCQECLHRVQVLLHESIAQGLHLQGWSYWKWLEALPSTEGAYPSLVGAWEDDYVFPEVYPNGSKMIRMVYFRTSCAKFMGTQPEPNFRCEFRLEREQGSIAEIQHEEWRCWKSQFFLAISMVSLTIQTQVSGISATTPIKSKHSATNMCANPYLRRLHGTRKRT